jgi:hypothetical protein
MPRMVAGAAWAACLFVIASGPAAVARESGGPSPIERAAMEAARERDLGDASKKLPEASGASVTSALPDSPSEVALADAATRQRYLNAMQRFYDYRANGYDYRSRVFEWQLFSSRVIFLIVLVLVAAGVYFAAVQFHVALAAARRGGASGVRASDADEAAGGVLKTQLEISAKGVIVNSSVLGVIILALSLAFFYLYLVYVYPIQNVF